MRHYKQLNHSEREEIALRSQQGQGPALISRALGRSTSTISRELKRNRTAKGSYTATHAHGKALSRRAKPSRLDQDETLRTFVEQRLMDGWSPEQIAGWLRGGNEGLSFINHESIYRYVYSKAGQTMKLYQYLSQRKKRRRALKARKSRDRIPNRISIHYRLQDIEEKRNIGDWEAD